MTRKNPKGQQLDTISREGDLFQASFDLRKQDQFVTSLGVQFIHYAAIPSPIGMKDKGGYRRSDTVDTITSNGFIFKKKGCFTATMVSNSSRKKWNDGGTLDDSTSRLVMPRFYDKGDEVAGGKTIYLSPGDRVYLADPDADTKVVNFQKMTFDPNNHNRPMFPILEVEDVVDSQGQEFQQGVDFEVDPNGDICWLPGGRNPGIDVETKEGRVYSVRYRYRAYWYIVQLPNEVRVTNVTTDGVRSPERMAYHAVVQREYVYHNQNASNKVDAPKPEDPKRTNQKPIESISPNSNRIKVNMDNIEDK